jgi:hypothetical protein
MKARRAGAILLAAGLLLPAAAQATEAPAERPVVELSPAFVIDAEGRRDFAEAPLRPGDLLGLALEWPEGSRPARPALAPAAPAGPTDPPGGALPRRLVARDPRAGGADVLEVQLAGLGTVELPALSLTDATGAPVAATRPLELTVEPALPADATEPADLRPPVGIPLDAAGVAVVATALLLALAALWVVVRRLRRRPAPAAPATPAAPPEPPDRRALRELDALLASGLLARGRVKEFSVRLAEIGKGYLAARSGRPLLERTTREAARELERHGGTLAALAPWLVRWLDRLDMVKFAGARPVDEELRAQAEALREVIERTSAPPDAAAGDAA